MAQPKIKPYALLRADHSSRYGHLRVVVHDLWPNIYSPPKLIIQCQTGGDGTSHSLYARRHGIEANLEPLTSMTLKEALRVSRKIDNSLAKHAGTGAADGSFGDYVVQILCAVGARNMHYIEGVNDGFSCEVKDLPMIDCMREPKAAMLKISQMADSLYALN